MPEYRVDMRDVKFVLNEYLDMGEVCGLPVYQERGFDAEMLNDMVEQGRKMAVEVIAPLNEPSDQEGCTFDNETGEVKVPECYHDAYKMYVENGWGSAQSNPEYGGMGVPELINTCVSEIFTGACTSFTMLPGLKDVRIAGSH